MPITLESSLEFDPASRHGRKIERIERIQRLLDGRLSFMVPSKLSKRITNHLSSEVAYQKAEKTALNHIGDSMGLLQGLEKTLSPDESGLLAEGHHISFSLQLPLNHDTSTRLRLTRQTRLDYPRAPGYSQLSIIVNEIPNDNGQDQETTYSRAFAINQQTLQLTMEQLTDPRCSRDVKRSYIEHAEKIHGILTLLSDHQTGNSLEGLVPIHD